MPGKMTVLDRLISEGRIKKSPFGVKKTSAELRDPLNYPLDMRKDFDRMKNAANTQWVKMTPERKVYQKGINALIDARKKPIQEKYDDTMGELSDLQDEFENAFDEAKENYIEQVRDNMESMRTPDIRRGFDPSYDFDLNVDGRESLESYWPDYDYRPASYYNSRGEELGDMVSEYEGRLESMDEPSYRMQEQTMTPRYRNYQRAMQQRAANMAMGRDLSRRYAIAYNNLLRRGLTPAEARMYMREYFGGR